MANVSITAANVVPSASVSISLVKYAAAVTAGQTIYRTANGDYGLARGNAEATAIPAGIAACNAAAGQYGGLITKDPELVIGGTVVQGTFYGVSLTTAGGIAPAADLGTASSYPAIFGVGLADNKLNVDFNKLQSGTTAAS